MKTLNIPKLTLSNIAGRTSCTVCARSSCHFCLFNVFGEVA